jgi:hypothetical protein
MTVTKKQLFDEFVVKVNDLVKQYGSYTVVVFKSTSPVYGMHVDEVVEARSGFGVLVAHGVSLTDDATVIQSAIDEVSV